MSEMIVKSPEVTKEYLDYDFTFGPNMILPVTIDLSGGDYVIDDTECIIIYMAAKPSVNDPEVMIPEETITVFKNRLLATHKRVRVQKLPSKEQLEELRGLLHPDPKTL